MQWLIGETETPYLLLLGAYRNNEVSAAHPLMLTVAEIRKLGVVVNQLTLAPLDLAATNDWVAATLRCAPERALPLSELVYRQTQGNPFFITQFLQALHQEGLIAYDVGEGCWQCDLAQVRALSASEDVVTFMATQLQKLPVRSQQVLKLAACMGNCFDLDTLALTHCSASAPSLQQSQSETAADLWPALQAGLVLPTSELYKFFPVQTTQTAASQSAQSLSLSDSPATTYKFLHDRVQQAAYSLIADSDRQSTHLKIGQLMLQETPVEHREEKIFDIVNQLNLGRALIAAQSERDQLAELNRIAGQKARAATAYAAAVRYLSTGIELLAADGWQRCYDLTLVLHELAAEAAYLSGDFEQMENLAETVLLQKQTLLHSIKVYEVKIQAYMAKNEPLAAVKIALESLRLLGIKLTGSPNKLVILLSLVETKLTTLGRKIETLIDLPEMTRPSWKAAMRLLSAVGSAAYFATPDLYPLIVFKQVLASVKYGNVAGSAFAYATYGSILCGVLGEIETGYQFGQVALKLLDRLEARDTQARTIFVVNSLIDHWKVHVRETLPPLQQAYQVGLDTGDLEFAALSILLYCCYSYFAGNALVTLERETEIYGQAMQELKQETALHTNNLYRQVILNLSGRAEDPCCLTGESYREQDMVLLHQKANDTTAIYSLYFHKLILCYVFRDYAQAVANAIEAEKYLEAAVATLGFALFPFYDSLARLALYPVESRIEKKRILRKVKANQKKLKKYARSAPMNHLHRFYLVEAERHRVLSQNVVAMGEYDRAIALAQEQGYIQEEALANELAACFYLSWGKQAIAQTYLTQAYYAYARWGARAKVEALEMLYPQLLAPILNREVGYRMVNAETVNQIDVATSTSTSKIATLDLAAVMKAAQALSEEIWLDRLLSTLLKVALENAGAEKCALVLLQEETLAIEAMGTTGVEETDGLNVLSLLQAIPLESCQELPVTTINYAWRTQDALLLEDATSESMFASDPYIVRQQPRSILCFPIFKQAKLLGILYLENNLTTAAFTQDRVEVLSILTSQAAIAIENARFYNTLEQKVAERTQELSQTLNRLKTAQGQLIEAEKMAALGGLVAGVAHEINTPVGTGMMAASILANETQSFRAAYAQGQLKRSMLDSYLTVAQESSDLILNNLKRAGELVQSFKQVAVDRTSMERRQFVVMDYLEETLLSLDPQLKQAQHTLTVRGDRTMTLESYPGALSQVVSHLVMNSIVHAYQPGQRGQLCFALSCDRDRLLIQYSDDGCGISAEIVGRIFEPFFTTARHQGSTGLGLHIVYNLVTQKLQGTIQCKSHPGSQTTFILDLPLTIQDRS